MRLCSNAPARTNADSIFMTHLPLLPQILVGGLLSMLAAAAVMWGLPRRWLPLAVSFSTGLLLAAALLDLLPAALETGLTPHEVFPVLLPASSASSYWKSSPSGAMPSAMPTPATTRRR